MKKNIRNLFVLVLTMLALQCLVFLGCSNPDDSSDNKKKGTTTTEKEYPEVPVGDFPSGELQANFVRIIYMEQNNDSDLAIWVSGGAKKLSDSEGAWPNGAFSFSTYGKTTTLGYKYIDIEMTSLNDILYFVILREKSDGDNGKDGGDRMYPFASIWSTIYLWPDDETSYISNKKNKSKGVFYGAIESDSAIEVYSLELKDDSLPVEDFAIEGKNGPITINSINKKAGVNNVYTASVNGGSLLGAMPITMTYLNKKKITVSLAAKYLDTQNIVYDGNDLGVTYNDSDKSATFKVWLPTATDAKVVIYKKADQKQVAGEFQLTLEGFGTSDWKGIWAATITPAQLSDSDTYGYFYQYKVTNRGETKLCLDPYAKSMAASYIDTEGKVSSSNPNADPDLVGKGAIINPSKVKIDAFSGPEGYKMREDAVIYEIHVRDFSSYWGLDGAADSVSVEGIADVSKPDGILGTYGAFIKNLDYLKAMGYTHVQILPVMKFYYGDETNKAIEKTAKARNCNYNWGYDPHSYFAPSGMYATDAIDPDVRIKELKELINAIHGKGIGVILDNVYNHNASMSILNDLVPYYYTVNINGEYKSDYGGSRIATNYKMVRKMIIDSVKYWFSEYKIDGMRWDLMGNIDSVTLKEAYDAAHAINGKAIFVGEGWRTGLFDDPNVYGANQEAMNEINDGADAFGRVAVFSDCFRDQMKTGPFDSIGTPSFISGGKVNITNLFKYIKGQPTNFNDGLNSKATKFTANSSGQVIQYIECHDNYPAADDIVWSTKIDPRRSGYDSDADFDAASNIIHRRIRLGNFMVLTSQGIAFLHAGQELGRTKYFGTNKPEDKYHKFSFSNGKEGYFIHDSFDSSDLINKIDWSLVATGKAGNKTANYTKGLIALRKSTDAFKLSLKDKIDSSIEKINFDDENMSDCVLGYNIKATDGTYFVFANGDLKARTVNPKDDLTSASVLVDGATAGVTKIASPVGVTITASLVTLDPLTATVIKK